LEVLVIINYQPRGRSWRTYELCK